MHSVLRECSRFVGAYNGNGAHCFAGVHFTHQVVGLEHSAHVEREAERHGHGQALGHGHYYQRYGHHEVVDKEFEHLEPVDFRPVVKLYKLVDGEHEERQYCHAEGYAAYEAREPFELAVEGRVGYDERHGLALHLTYLGCVANGGYLHRPAAFHHHGRAQGNVLCVCRRRFISGFYRLRHGRLARKARLVNLQRHSLQEHAVGRHFIALAEYHYVAHYNVGARYFGYVSAADHLDGRLAAYGVELVETAGGVVLKIKGYACGKEYGTEDSYGLGILVLDYRHHERQAGCQQEYADNRVVELAEV